MRNLKDQILGFLGMENLNQNDCVCIILICLTYPYEFVKRLKVKLEKHYRFFNYACIE